MANATNRLLTRMSKVKNASWKRLRFFQTDSHPVVCVSRRDAMAYAEWLSRETGRTYRLPTLVEWQYAARAGSDFAMLHRGRDSEGRPNHNHCGRENLDEDTRDDKRCVDGVENTAQVGSFPPNAIGLHDVIGNVSEWVSSCFIEGKGLLPRTRVTITVKLGIKSLEGEPTTIVDWSQNGPSMTLRISSTTTRAATTLDSDS